MFHLGIAARAKAGSACRVHLLVRSVVQHDPVETAVLVIRHACPEPSDQTRYEALGEIL